MLWQVDIFILLLLMLMFVVLLLLLLLLMLLLLLQLEQRVMSVFFCTSCDHFPIRYYARVSAYGVLAGES